MTAISENGVVGNMAEPSITSALNGSERPAKRFYCMLCPRSFSRKYDCGLHQKKHENVKEKSTSFSIPMKDNTEGWFVEQFNPLKQHNSLPLLPEDLLGDYFNSSTRNSLTHFSPGVDINCFSGSSITTSNPNNFTKTTPNAPAPSYSNANFSNVKAPGVSAGVSVVFAGNRSSSNQQGTSLSSDSPLHVACRMNHIEVVKLLISAGKDVDQLLENLDSPLHVAADYGHAEICALLLAAGCKSSATNREGFTPLYLASRNGNFAAVKTLLQFTIL